MNAQKCEYIFSILTLWTKSLILELGCRHKKKNPATHLKKISILMNGGANCCLGNTWGHIIFGVPKANKNISSNTKSKSKYKTALEIRSVSLCDLKWSRIGTMLTLWHKGQITETSNALMPLKTAIPLRNHRISPLSLLTRFVRWCLRFGLWNGPRAWKTRTKQNKT